MRNHDQHNKDSRYVFIQANQIKQSTEYVSWRAVPYISKKAAAAVS